MFWAPLSPSSGAHDDSVGYNMGCLVLELLLVGKLSEGRIEECPDRRLLQPSVRTLTQTAYLVTNAIVVSSC